MKRITYDITTTHPTGYRDGTHTVEVAVNPNGTCYVKGGGFGCSRDYHVKTDKAAIQSLLAEHAMTLVKIAKA